MSQRIVPELKKLLKTKERLSRELVLSVLSEQIKDLDHLEAFVTENESSLEPEARTLLLDLARAQQVTVETSSLLKRLESDEEFRRAFVRDPVSVLRRNVKGFEGQGPTVVSGTTPDFGCSAAKKSVVAIEEVGCSAAKKSIVALNDVDFGCSAAKKSAAVLDSVEFGCSAAKKSVAVFDNVDFGCSAAKKSVVAEPIDFGCSAAKKSVASTDKPDVGCSAAKKSVSPRSRKPRKK